jgi:hypothetical protein
VLNGMSLAERVVDHPKYLDMVTISKRGGVRPVRSFSSSPSVPRESTRLMSTGGAKLWV